MYICFIVAKVFFFSNLGVRFLFVKMDIFLYCYWRKIEKSTRNVRLHALYTTMMWAWQNWMNTTMTTMTQLLPLFCRFIVWISQLHWFTSLFGNLLRALEKVYFQAQNTRPKMITRFSFLLVLRLLFHLLVFMVLCLRCHTFLCNSLSQWYCCLLLCRVKPITIGAVSQIPFRWHSLLARQCSSSIYKSTRFACKIKESYLILRDKIPNWHGIKVSVHNTLTDNLFSIFFLAFFSLSLSSVQYYLLQCQCYFTCSHFPNYIMFYNWIDRLYE